MSNAELMTKNINEIKDMSNNLSSKLLELESSLQSVITEIGDKTTIIDNTVSSLTIFILSCIVGYYIVWRVTPALHTPLMAVTNAISGIIIVGAMIAAGSANFNFSNIMGLVAIILASINIFGGFFVAYRMLSMFRRKS